MQISSTETVEILVPEEYYEGCFEHPQDYDSPTHLPYPLWKYPDSWVTSKREKLESAWWEKQTEKSYRTCPSFVNVFKKTIVIPMMADFAIKVTGDGLEYKVASDIMSMSHDSNHPHEQFAGLIPNNMMNIKFCTPLALKMGRRQSVMITDSHLHSSNYVTKPWRPMTGLVGVEKNLPIIINTLWDIAHLSCLDKCIIELGTPLAYITLPEAKGKVDIKFVKVSNNYKDLFWKKTLNSVTRFYKL